MGLMDAFKNWFGGRGTRVIWWPAGTRGPGPVREIYEHDVVRAVVDCIATHAAKSTAMHVRVDDKGRISEILRNSDLSKLLTIRPNGLMTAYDLKYKLVTQLLTRTTSMAYIRWDGPHAVGIYPIDYQQYEIFEGSGGVWGVTFTDPTGQQYTLPLDETAVLRKYYNADPVYGSGNRPLIEAIGTMQSADRSVRDSVDISNKARILHKTKKSMLSPADKTGNAEEFAKRFDEAGKNGGVVSVDLTEEVTPFDIKPYALTADQYDKIRERLLSYFRVSDAILSSNYTDSQYQAFYESVIEPILLQMSEAFTAAAFTQGERDRGNRILFTAPMLLHASTSAKAQLISTARETGLFTINEQRELLGYPPIEGGDERQVSLNYVNASQQDLYQTGTTPANTDEGEQNDGSKGQENT